MRKSSFLYWCPRLASVLFIAYVMLFSLDVFESGKDWMSLLFGLFMHNIPAFILILITSLAWKKDLIGFIGFGLLGVIMLFLVLLNSPNLEAGSIPNFGISIPSLFISFLYVLNWTLNKPKKI